MAKLSLVTLLLLAYLKTCKCGDTCDDGNTSCGNWARAGECEKNPGYMQKQCKKSCGLCDTCDDGNSSCGNWAKAGECEKNPGYMQKQCKKSCGLCGTTPVTTRPVTNGKYGCSSGIQRYPHSFKNSYYYTRICYTSRGSLKVISSNKASDASIERTAFLIDHVMDKVDARVPAKMNEKNFRHAVMGAYPKEVTTNIPEHAWLGAHYNERARGLGATVGTPVGSSAEENAMCYANDRYLGEDITIHEFAHSLHLTGFALVFPSFNRELEGLYNSAKRYNIWPGHYAMTDFKEYFAEGVQSYFNANMAANNGPTDRYQLEQSDPNFFKFLDNYLGGNSWSRTCP